MKRRTRTLFTGKQMVPVSNTRSHGIFTGRSLPYVRVLSQHIDYECFHFSAMEIYSRLAVPS